MIIAEMFPTDWQTLIALVIVGVAVAAFARRIWNSLTSISSLGCGTSCGSCPANENPSSLKTVQLVQLEVEDR